MPDTSDQALDTGEEVVDDGICSRTEDDEDEDEEDEDDNKVEDDTDVEGEDSDEADDGGSAAAASCAVLVPTRAAEVGERRLSRAMIA